VFADLLLDIGSPPGAPTVVLIERRQTIGRVAKAVQSRLRSNQPLRVVTRQDRAMIQLSERRFC
jgi:hypothetical protein